MKERAHRMILAVVLEPLRHLHSSFLKYAHSAVNTLEWPKLLDEVSPSRSQYVAILQYYSHLLAGNGSRLRLIFQMFGCATLDQWICDEPALASAARSQIAAVATVLSRRYRTTILKWPWRLYALADLRLSVDEHAQIVDEFWRTPNCCLPPGIARQIKAACSSKEVFLQDLGRWRWLLLMSALTVKLTIASVERRHATHKQNSHPQMPMHLFAADSILAESRHQQMALQRLEVEREARALFDARPIEDHGDQVQSVVDLKFQFKRSNVKKTKKEASACSKKASRLRSPSVWDLWRNDWFRKEKDAGRKRWPGDKECWRLCKEEFASLDQTTLDLLHQRSEALSISVGMTLGRYNICVFISHVCSPMIFWCFHIFFT